MKTKSILAMLVFAMAALSWSGAQARDPRPGLFVRMGEAYIFRIVDGQPAQARRAAQGEQAGEGEVRVEVSARGGTVMTVTNRTGGTLNYEAYIAGDEFEKGTRTSVCTLLNGPFAIEQWPSSLPGIRVTNFEPAGDSMVCR
jgi:hypothetical protein